MLHVPMLNDVKFRNMSSIPLIHWETKPILIKLEAMMLPDCPPYGVSGCLDATIPILTKPTLDLFHRGKWEHRFIGLIKKGISVLLHVIHNNLQCGQSL